MASKPISRGVQDLPPKGGFPMVRLNRGLGKRGPSGLLIWAAIIGLSLDGLYKLSKTNKRSRFERQEQREARMGIIPFLMHERDRLNEAEYDREVAREAEIMKGRKDWIPGEKIYSKRWLPPTPGLGK